MSIFKSIFLFLQLCIIFAAATFTAGTDSPTETSFGVAQILKIAGYAFIISSGALVWALSNRARRGLKHTLRANKELVWFFLLCAALIPFSYYPSYSITKLVTTLMPIASLFLLSCQYFYLSRRPSGTLSTHIMYLFFVGTVYGLVNLAISQNLGFRVAPTGGLTHPNIFSAFLALGFIYAMYFRSGIKNVRRGILISVARLTVYIFAPILILILLSRGVIIASAAATTSVLVFGAATGRKNSASKIIFIALSCGVIALSFNEELVGYLTRGDDANTLTSLTGRTDVWAEIWRNVTPGVVLTGFGYAVTFPSLVLEINYGEIWGAHNAFLQSFTSAGIFGSLLVAMYLGRGITALVLRGNKFDRETRSVLLAFLVFVFTNSFTESIIGTNAPPVLLTIFLLKTWVAFRNVEAQLQKQAQNEPAPVIASLPIRRARSF